MIKLSLSRCSKYGHTKTGCELINDPYCGWDVSSQTCTTILDKSKHNFQFFDNQCSSKNYDLISKLPNEWSSWSSWYSTIQQNPNYLHLKNCLFRFRTCLTQHSLKLNTSNCLNNHAIEISNCSLDGSWTYWSTWSECQPTCNSILASSNLISTKTRVRWCSNPIPIGQNGIKCQGLAKQIKNCKSSENLCSGMSVLNFKNKNLFIIYYLFVEIKTIFKSFKDNYLN